VRLSGGEGRSRERRAEERSAGRLNDGRRNDADRRIAFFFFFDGCFHRLIDINDFWFIAINDFRFVGTFSLFSISDLDILN
jgi:hypothetical protein